MIPSGPIYMLMYLIVFIVVAIFLLRLVGVAA